MKITLECEDFDRLPESWMLAMIEEMVASIRATPGAKDLIKKVDYHVVSDREKNGYEYLGSYETLRDPQPAPPAGGAE